MTNEQVAVMVNRDEGRMLTKTIVEEITYENDFRRKPLTITDAIG